MRKDPVGEKGSNPLAPVPRIQRPFSTVASERGDKARKTGRPAELVVLDPRAMEDPWTSQFHPLLAPYPTPGDPRLRADGRTGAVVGLWLPFLS